MAKDFSTLEDSNRSGNSNIHDLSDPSRRIVLRGGAAGAVGALLAPLAGIAGLPGCASLGGGAALGFKSVPVSAADALTVPEGYSAQVIAPWGDPVGLSGDNPAFKPDASNSAAEQEAQMGMHHDGIHYFAQDGSNAGLLVMNHEYTDDGLLHADGMKTWSAQKVRKAQAAHGVAVIEVRQSGGRWEVVRPSPWARRFTATTPMTFGGPAAGHALLRTAADARGMRPLGTINNCASGITPWGTYLTCEENFIFYFKGPDQPNAHEQRWGLRKGDPVGYRWHEFDERFDATKHPNEPNRFGWVVEIDPLNPSQRAGQAHGARPRRARGRDGGHHPRRPRGGLHGRGRALRVHLQVRQPRRHQARRRQRQCDAARPRHAVRRPLRCRRPRPLAGAAARPGPADRGQWFCRSRRGADQVAPGERPLGATKMDRPEWIAVDAKTSWVYCTLTNNSNRGGSNQPAVDAANPRANNTMGHIIRWKESGDFDGTAFEWNHFVLAGDPANERAEAKGNVKGDAFGCPDGLWIDGRGVLWVQTDMSTSAMGKGDLAKLGNNVMLAVDPSSGDTRRFLVGPAGCEVTGVTGTPDGRTMFVNIQHPGESPSERSEPEQPRRYSNWPDFNPNGRPRSATVVIRKLDGGVIGT